MITVMHESDEQFSVTLFVTLSNHPAREGLNNEQFVTRTRGFELLKSQKNKRQKEKNKARLNIILVVCCRRSNNIENKNTCKGNSNKSRRRYCSSCDELVQGIWVVWELETQKRAFRKRVAGTIISLQKENDTIATITFYECHDHEDPHEDRCLSEKDITFMDRERNSSKTNDESSELRWRMQVAFRC